MVQTFCIMADDLVGIVGLALRLNLPRQWLTAEADAGRIPFLQAGRRRLFSVTGVRSALAKRAAKGDPQPVDK
jgi:hypothetical protein